MAKKPKTIRLEDYFDDPPGESESKTNSFLEAAKNVDLDKLNEDRAEKSRLRVAEAIVEVDSTGLSRIPFYLSDDEVRVCWESAQKKLAKAIHLVSDSREDMEFACHHFHWNDEIVSDLDGVLERLGAALAAATVKNVEDGSSAAFEAVAKMAPVLATLTTWNDEEDGEDEDEKEEEN